VTALRTRASNSNGRRRKPSARNRAGISIVWFVVAAVLVFSLSLAAAWGWYIRMPGISYAGPQAQGDAAVQKRLRRSVVALAQTIGERNVARAGSLDDAASWISDELAAAGYSPVLENFAVGTAMVSNVYAEVPGRSGSGVVVVGAHYDSVPGSPGADDNASGVAVMLELARRLRDFDSPFTLRFIAFANEESPWFGTASMGSLQHAERAMDRGEDIVAMLSLEMLGFYDSAKGSQSYPNGFGLFYPSTGNFVSFVGNARSRSLVHELVAGFRQHARLPSEGAALPEIVKDITRSDHLAFWQQGVAAVMITDTANFRNPHYHQSTDVAETLDYSAMAHVVEGLTHAIEVMVASRYRAR